MQINRAVFDTTDNQITIMRNGSGWYMQVMRGTALTQHVESKNFASYHEAFTYIVRNYLEG